MSLANEPIRFRPVYQKRVWGGRKLASKFGRELPEDGEPYGEAWDVVDRAEAQSVVLGGVYDGLSLGELWGARRDEVFGADAPEVERFPVLVKILDARQTLSVQVHPHRGVAGALGGEAKSEFWWVVDAEPGAAIYSGVREGTGKEAFEAAVGTPAVEGVLSRIGVARGEHHFLPGGRLHALGEGVAVIEIQSNSDTTYRIHDWGRVGLDGKPRTLHLEAALRSVQLESGSAPPGEQGSAAGLVDAGHGFWVTEAVLPGGQVEEAVADGEMGLFVVAKGAVRCAGQRFAECDSFLVPARRAAGDWSIRADDEGAVLLRTGFECGG